MIILEFPRINLEFPSEIYLGILEFLWFFFASHPLVGVRGLLGILEFSSFLQPLAQSLEGSTNLELDKFRIP